MFSGRLHTGVGHHLGTGHHHTLHYWAAEGALFAGAVREPATAAINPACVMGYEGGCMPAPPECVHGGAGLISMNQIPVAGSRWPTRRQAGHHAHALIRSPRLLAAYWRLTSVGGVRFCSGNVACRWGSVYASQKAALRTVEDGQRFVARFRDQPTTLAVFQCSDTASVT